MERVDFYSVTQIVRKNLATGAEPKQIVLVERMFKSYISKTGQKFENTQVFRWLNGQMPVSLAVTDFYTKKKHNKNLLKSDLQNYIIPDIPDREKTGNELIDLVTQDTSISDSKREELLPERRVLFIESVAEYVAELLIFSFERPFVKREAKTGKLLPVGTLSPIISEYIYRDILPDPCKHFMGRDEELSELEALLEKEHKVFVRGIAGIGKSELVRAYIQKNEKQYTNIIYLTYSGSLFRDIADMSFADDRYNEDDKELFKKHNHFLRTLKEDTLLVIDNFNTTPDDEELFSVVYKYRCKIIFTTRSRFEEYAGMEISEIRDMDTLVRLAGCFFEKVSEYNAVVRRIIEVVYSHTLAVELAARLLKRGILEPEELLDKLIDENVKINVSDKVNLDKDGIPRKDTYYGHIHTLFALYQLDEDKTSMMRCLTLVPVRGVSARVFAHWMGAENMNDIDEMIETGFVKEENEYDILLHPMIRDIAVADTEPSVSNCGSFLKNIEKDLLTFEEFSYYHSLLDMMDEVIARIRVDDPEGYFEFLSACFLKYGEYRYLDEQRKALSSMEELMDENRFTDVCMQTMLLSYQSHMKERAGELDEALKLALDAVELAKDTVEAYGLTCNLYSEISYIYMQMDNLDEAEKYGFLAEDYLQEVSLSDVRMQISVRSHSAFVLCQRMAYSRAVQSLNKMKKELKKHGLLKEKAEAYLEEALGLIYLNWFNVKEAETHFDKARFAYADIWNSDPELVEIREQEMKARFPAAGINIREKLAQHNIYAVAAIKGKKGRKRKK